MEFKCGSCKMMDFFWGGGEGGGGGQKARNSSKLRLSSNYFLKKLGYGKHEKVPEKVMEVV